MRLELEEDVRVVGEVGDGAAVARAAEELQPDVIVMDYEMPERNGAEATLALRSAGGRAMVVMLSIHDGASVRKAASAAGVFRFVAKHEPSEALLAAIRAAAAHGEASRA